MKRTTLALALSLSACHAGSVDSASTDAPSASAAKPSAPGSSGSAAVAASASTAARPGLPLCRASTVLGTAKLTSFTGAPLALATLSQTSEMPEDAWIDLESGGKVTATHPHSTRETTFVGPARIRTCVGHGEEAWVQSGKFESVLASGERPGGEQWVVTPVGVIRYGSAKASVFVGSESAGGIKTEIKVESGTAFAWTGDLEGPLKPPVVAPHVTDGGAVVVPDGWTRLDGPRTVTLTQTKTPKPLTPSELAQVAIDRCKVEAKNAKDAALAVSAPDASLAKTAPKQVMARHLARAACDVALLRVGSLDASPARDAFNATLKEAETDWKGRIRGPRGRFH